MSNERLIDELSQRLAPVRRRNTLREAGWLAALGGLELALVLAAGLARPDIADVIGQPFMGWKLGSLAVLALLTGVTALRSFSPPASPRPGLALAAGSAGLAVLAGLVLGLAADGAPGIAERLMPAHGLRCAASIAALSLPVLGMLTVLMRRNASAHAEGSALAAGLAAGSWGAFVFAFCCPMNDPCYILVWYSAACALVASAARLLLPRFAAL